MTRTPTPRDTKTADAACRIDVAGPDDAATVAPLFDAYRQFYRQPSDPALALAFVGERLRRRESVILLARGTDGEALGFTQLYPSFSSVSAYAIWVLNDLYVLPQARGRGVGRALLDAARAQARAAGARRLDLSTAHDNPAQKLYEAAGYRRESGFYHYSLPLA